MNEIFEHLKNLEIRLHGSVNGVDASSVQNLLHAEFIEFGYSGKTYDYKSILDSFELLMEGDSAIWSQTFDFTKYTPDVVQVRYLSASMNGDGKLSRYAKRSSLWVNMPGNWQLKFHQATPTAPFSKENE